MQDFNLYPGLFINFGAPYDRPLEGVEPHHGDHPRIDRIYDQRPAKHCFPRIYQWQLPKRLLFQGLVILQVIIPELFGIIFSSVDNIEHE